MDRSGALTRAVARFAADRLDGATSVCVGLSGGPDSLALTAASVHAGLSVRALVVDHRLQPGSSRVAQRAADEARRMGATAVVLPVRVAGVGGPEAAARDARYAALNAARDGAPVLLAHTADDQAETVLLGLARGSGARSISGMRGWSAPWGRPLLGLRRADTVGACAELGLVPHRDPHNTDRRFTRSRLRTEVVPLLDDVLHGGVVPALARTASLVRADNEALDALAERVYVAAAVSGGLLVSGPAEQPTALRTRVVRRWLRDVGATEVTSALIEAVDALVTGVGRGRVAVGGDADARVVVRRSGEWLVVDRESR